MGSAIAKLQQVNKNQPVKWTTSGSGISLTNSAFTQFRTSNYVWGLDLSQTIQGAGGVSGLLSLDKGTATYYYNYDGNVSELIDTAGVVKAHYEYCPFGKLTDEMPDAVENPFKFSTKYLDNETQLYYYGLRGTTIQKTAVGLIETRLKRKGV